MQVRHISTVNNSLQPTMHIQIDSTPSGGSLVRTRYTTHVFVRVLLIVWMTFAVAMSIVMLVGHAAELSFVVAFPFFGVFLIVLMRVFARRDEARLEDLVRNIVDSSERDA